MGQTTVLHLPFTGGMDQKTAAEYLDPSSHVALVTNGDFDKSGVINKRIGMKSLPTGAITPGNPIATPISSANRLTSWTRSQLAMFANATMYNYSQATGSFTAIAPAPATRVVRRPFLSPTLSPFFYAPVAGDVVYNGRTIRVVMYQTPTYATYISAFDADSGDVVLQPTLINQGNLNFAYIPFGVYYLPGAPAAQQCAIIYGLFNAGTTTLYGVSLNLATNALSTPVAMYTNYSMVDVAPVVGSTTGALAGMSISTGGVVTYAFFNASFGLTSSGTIETTSGTGYSCAVHAAVGGNVWFGYVMRVSATQYNVRVAAIDSGTAAPSYSFFPLRTYSVPCGVTGIIPFTNPGTAGSSAMLTFTVQNNTSAAGGMDTSAWYAGVVTTASYSQVVSPLPYGMQPIARPFVQNGQVLQPAVWSNLSNTGLLSLQATVYVIAINPSFSCTIKGLPVATIAPRQCVQPGGSQSLFAAFSGQVGARVPFGTSVVNTARVAFPFTTIGEDSLGDVPGGIGNATWFADVTADVSLLYQCGELVDGLHVSAATPMATDGQTLIENNFFHYPEFAYITSAGSSSPISGKYFYQVAYVFADSAGNLTRSAPWQLTPVTLSVNGTSPTLHIPALSTTWRELATPGQVFAEIYRTTSNGSTFYLIATVPVQYSGGPPYVTWGPDQIADTTINVASLEYVTGGVLDAVNPPSAACQVIHKNRLWIVDDTLRNVWFTKAGTQGDAVSFNEVLTFPCSEGGDITALASLDDKLVIFKADSIYLIYGDGPADTGQGSDLTVPQRIATDVGALDWRSVVLMPQGLMFRSAQGIYLLDRGQSVTNIGKNVEDTLAAYPTVVGATLVSSAQHVRFLCTDGSATVALVYDYQSQAWGTYTYSTTASAPVSCAMTFGTDRFAIATTDGHAWVEHAVSDSTAYQDDTTSGVATFVSTSVTTPWVKLQGLQAYLRARRAMFFGTAVDSHGLTMGFATNYKPSIVQSRTWTSNALSFGSQVEEHFAGMYNKSMAVQIVITDTPGLQVTTGAGCRFVGLAIELDDIGQKYRKNAVMARG